MSTRPDLIVKPGQAFDVYELLNAQNGFPNVAAGTKLRLQNKSSTTIYIHEIAGEPKNLKDGIGIYQRGWRIETSSNAPGVKVSAESVALVGVEVVE